MISWIKGELEDLWQINNKFFVLINCHGLGYEIQVKEPFFYEINGNESGHKDYVLWLKHIKKEDSDTFFGFNSKNERDFFNEILNIKGIGSQIGIGLLNKLTLNEIKNAIITNDKKLISSVQGIGQKMTERIILELKNKLNTQQKQNENDVIKDYLYKNQNLSSILKDVEITLESLNYPKKDIKKVYQLIINSLKSENNSFKEKNNISFEILLKEAMNYLDDKNSNLVQLHSKIE